ncbi:MAG: hypothetical protein ACHQNT_00020 [Bacteroidia bacterium]
MKKIILSVLIALICFGISFGQKPSKEIPNYLLAENSNFIVQITTPSSKMKTQPGVSVLDVFQINHMKKIVPEDYPNLDEGLFKALTVMMKNEFASMNMNPAAFVSLSNKDVQNAEFMKNLQDQYLDIKPGFVVNIALSDWDKEKKAFEKNKLELDDVKPVTLMISKLGDTDVSNMFLLFKMSMSVAEMFKDLKKMIADKGPSYFIKYMDIDEEIFSNSEFNNEMYEKLLTESAVVEKYPDEKGLKEAEVLVLTYSKKDDMYYKQTLKNLQKYYPYKYKVIEQKDLPEHLNKDYKYLLFAKGEMAQKVKFEDGKRETRPIYLMHYVLKDLQTKEIFYGPDKNKLIKNASSSPSYALKHTLKYMQDFYGWQDK